jgi:outer membrane protein assembly factor BamB
MRLRCLSLLLLPLLALLCGSCLYGSGKGTELQPKVLWSYRLGSARDLTADYIGDNTIVCSSTASLDWVDTRNGQLRHQVSDPQSYGPGLIWFAAPDGQVFYMMQNNFYNYSNRPGEAKADVLSCRGSDGNLEWEVSIPAGEQLISSAIGPDRVFMILGNGCVMAVSRAGETLWYRQLDAVRLTGFAAFISSRLIYLDRSGQLCVANEDGDLIWRSEEQLGFYSSTLELEDGSLALYDYPLALRYFDDSGQLLWKAEFSEYAPGRGRLNGAANVSQYEVDRMLDALPGNGVAIAHPDGRISAYDASGDLQWRSQAVGQAPLICTDLAGNVFVVKQGESISAFKDSGRPAWVFEQLGNLNSAPSVDNQGHVFVETDSDLYCLDTMLNVANPVSGN